MQYRSVMEDKLRSVDKTAYHGTLEKLWTEFPLFYSMFGREELKCLLDLLMSGLVQIEPVRKPSSVTVQVPGQASLYISYQGEGV